MAAREQTSLLTGDDKRETWLAAARRHAALVGSVLFFMLSSTSMLLVNKAVLKVWELPITMALIQMAFAAVALLVAHPCVKLCAPDAEVLRVGSWSDARRWSLYMPLLFAGMMATSLLALEHSTTGAVVVTRNVGPIITLPIEALSGEKVAVDAWTVLALLWTLGGVVVYMLDDLAEGYFSAVGYAAILANIMVVVVMNVVTRRLLAVRPVDLSKLTAVLINNALGLPLVALLLVPTGEAASWHTLRASDPDGAAASAYTAAGAYALVVASCVAGLAIGWAGVNAQARLTATSFMVVGNLNKFMVIGVGMISMHEANSWYAILGCCVAVSGGLFYGGARANLGAKRAKMAEEMGKAAASAAPSPVSRRCCAPSEVRESKSGL